MSIVTELCELKTHAVLICTFTYTRLQHEIETRRDFGAQVKVHISVDMYRNDSKYLFGQFTINFYSTNAFAVCPSISMCVYVCVLNNIKYF